MRRTSFSPARLWAMMLKELIQMRRDRFTFAMMVGIPLLQLILFGYAINTNPKNLPTAMVIADQSPFARTILAAVENSGYFRVTRRVRDAETADRLLDLGEVRFVPHIPVNFGRDLVRGERPALLVQADATDPAAVGNALWALRIAIEGALERDLRGALVDLQARPGPVESRIHARYNPEAVIQYNVVPGLMGVVLTMTMVIITALAVTRERERGTMENLLTSPIRPLEVMLGKIFPYIAVGYVQMIFIVVVGHYLFHVPIQGDLVLLFLVSVVFIAANLAMGITFSTLAVNQLQAFQMAFFFFLPSMLLSGFMFPLRGMPAWLRMLAELLPLTHYLRLVRGIILKGNGWAEASHHLWPILLFMLVVLAISLKRYRQTLD